MLRHFIHSLFRSIKRRKLLSTINITGFAFAIAFVLLIGQYIYYEYNMNNNIPEVENTYRIINCLTSDYGIDYRVRDAIIESVPGVKSAGIFNHFSIEANTNDQFYKIEHLIVADKGFLDIYNFRFLYGSKEISLRTPADLIITESAAIKFFGTSRVIGKSIVLDHDSEMLITGVIKDPENISLQVEIIAKYDNIHKEKLAYRAIGVGKTVLYPFSTIVKLYDNVNPDNVTKKISSLHSRHKIIFPPKVKLVPLNKNYFNTDYNDYDLTHGNLDLVRILSVIGLLILILAVINYVNLTTAAYRYRLTEIGIKKCFGIERYTLLKELLMESVIISFISAIFSILIAELFLPFFSEFTEKQIPIQIFHNFRFAVIFIIFIAITGILSGIIPSLVLSKISPSQLFRFDTYIKGQGKYFRNLLTIFQFSIATLLIFVVIVMANQIEFVKHKDIGFNTEKLLFIKTHYKMRDRITAIANKLSAFPAVKSLTKTFGIPGDLLLEGNEGKIMVIDSLSIKTFGFNILNGRNFLPGDFNRNILINMAAWKKWEQENFSKEIFRKEKIVGVVSDFNFAPLYSANQPLVLYYSDKWGTSHITLRISGQTANTIEYIKKCWTEICPEYPMEIGFYDEMFASYYRNEEHLAALINIFSVLAVIISSLGIFGLAFYQSERRTKEIGIRKVLGAAPLNIVCMLISGYGLLILVSDIIALPAGYYFMKKWLEQFAYRIELSWLYFFLTAVISLIIAISAVIFQSLKAAMVKPVNSLKYE